MKISGVNQGSNQSYNRSLVLRTIQHMKHCSRVELARKTGLKQATISHIINDFIEWGLVEETGSFSGTKGRRTIGVRFSDRRFRVIGFRLTRQNYTIGVFTLGCEETCERICENIENSDPEYILKRVCAIINRIIAEHSDFTFLGVGVSVPGPYYNDSGEIAMISTFPGWKNIKICKIMQSRISIPVIVDHDANAGALAESSLVDGRDMYDTMVYVSAGQGIGAGIINRGDVFKGALGVAGEIGHTCVDVNGPVCDCGRRGCLTQYASTIALTRNIAQRLNRSPISFPEAVDLLKAGVPEAEEEFHSMMRYMNVGIANLLYIYNPNCIVIGDEIASIGQPVLDELIAHLQCLNAGRLVDQVQIELAQMGYDSAYIGSAIVVTRYIFDRIGQICEVPCEA